MFRHVNVARAIYIFTREAIYAHSRKIIANCISGFMPDINERLLNAGNRDDNPF